jgi:hypothetical protein
MNYEKLGFLPGCSVQRVAGVVNRRPFSGKWYTVVQSFKRTLRTATTKFLPLIARFKICQQSLMIKTAKTKAKPLRSQSDTLM